MTEPYHKIQSVFKRDPDNDYKTFLFFEWTNEVFEYLAGSPWVGTEKIDGTNIRLSNQAEQLVIQGRTDKAQLPKPLVANLTEQVDPGLIPPDVTLYGEGYGAGIQSGGHYRPDQAFCLFDVRGPRRWWDRREVEELAYLLDVPYAPVVDTLPLYAWVQQIENGYYRDSLSHPGADSEGVVLRPEVELESRYGRVITKLKYRDFPDE